MNPFAAFKDDVPERVAEARAAATERRAPERWRDARDRVAAERARFDALMAERPDLDVYGVNTLSGHRDAEGGQDPAKVNAALLESHDLPVGGGAGVAADPFNEDAVLCVTAAKICQIAAGGSLVAPQTYDALIAFIEDKARTHLGALHPTSYSCGDVIPGARWAHIALARGERPLARLAPGEAMALINGSFVQTGVALHIAEPLHQAVCAVLETAGVYLHLIGGRRGLLDEAGAGADPFVARWARRWAERLAPDDVVTTPQAPVSARALAQIAIALVAARRDFEAAIARGLSEPSNNPLMRVGEDGAVRLVSQGSFLALDLTLATERLIDVMLAVLWNIAERTKHLLSGAVEGVARDGASADNPIRHIQLPKAIQAALERARRRFGVRAFATGGATSYGVEDFWTHGLGLLHDLRALMMQLSEVGVAEGRVLAELIPPETAERWRTQDAAAR